MKNFGDVFQLSQGGRFFQLWPCGYFMLQVPFRTGAAAVRRQLD